MSNAAVTASLRLDLDDIEIPTPRDLKPTENDILRSAREVLLVVNDELSKKPIGRITVTIPVAVNAWGLERAREHLAAKGWASTVSWALPSRLTVFPRPQNDTMGEP